MMKSNILILLAIQLVSCFNLSPSPNIIINKPSLSTYVEQTRSSYFGYSVNLRRNSILIGAPRAQSTLAQQRKIDEPGAIYKCNFHDDQPCHPYHFDLNGNTHVENTDLAYNSEKKDGQMLGASMDGHGDESDRFVVCAPKLIGNVEELHHYLLHGICYWVANTNSTQPSGVRQIFPLRAKDLQTVPTDDDPTKFNYYYIYGESGFSVHVTDDNEEIIIGAPGIHNWRGSIIRYKARERPNIDGLSKRDMSPMLHAITKRQVFEYRSEIPNPFFSTVSDDSYFGYAVSSANFMGPTVPRLYYVASAPQANKQTGEVFVFDIEDYQFKKKIKVFNKFNGEQMGEYFGYTLLTEDFNGDNLPDIAVSAPFYSKTGEFENGAVYIFINEGNLAFKQQPIITSDYDLNGRFGIALSKIGDINLDGYNDIAISSPFEDNGAVYIHLGGPDGISLKASQKIQAPSELPSPFDGTSQPMFGHGISRGVDIDRNGYNDLAIGAPNSESVYIYKTYPVIKVVASITPSKNEITMEESRFTMKVCARYESMTNIDQEVDFSMSLSLDVNHNRASFSPQSISKVFSDNIKLINEDTCWDYTVHVRGTLHDIFKPIVIEMKYDSIEKIPEFSKEFCETCVTMDPRELKFVKTQVAFSTGCSGERCISDLSVVGTLMNVKQPYVLGSTNTIAIQFEISNSGESAYLTQLKITIPTNVTQFSRIPPSCRHEGREMFCDINAGKPLALSERTELIINLDATKLEGTSFKVQAQVSSAGDEKRPEDNEYETEIFLTEFSDIELLGQSSVQQLSIEDGLRVESIQYSYKIYNNGPSTIKELLVSIQVPTIYIPQPNYHVPIVDFNLIDIRGFYINKVYDVTWSKDNKILMQSMEDGSTEYPIAFDNMNLNFDSSRLGFDYDLNSPKDDSLAHLNHRKRRSLWQNDDDNIFRVYNQYTGSVDEYHSSYRIASDKEDQTLKNLPKNRTIYFDCSTSEEMDECVEAQFTIHNFRPGSEPISIALNFSIDLFKIDEIFNERQNIFLYKTNTKFQRGGDEELKSLKVTMRNPYTIIYEQLSTGTPLWIWFVSTMVGILVLILLSYALYKLGFFKRTRKEEMERLTRESRNISAEEAEELKNLNT